MSSLGPPASEAGRRAAVERRFLGWSEPFLPAVAAELARGYSEGGELRLREVVLAVPGARAGRRLKELLVAEAEELGLRLVPPRVVTIGGVPELLYVPSLPLAPAALSRRAWAMALRDLSPDHLRVLFPAAPERGDLRGWARLARMVEKLHRELAGAGLRFAQVGPRCAEGLLFPDVGRWEALAGAEERYGRPLAGLGFGDAGLQRMSALRRGELGLEGELWLCGVAEMPRSSAAMIAAAAASGARIGAFVNAPAEESAAFDEVGCIVPAAWIGREVPLDDRQITVCGGPGEQADVVIRGIAALDGRYSAGEIVIAAPDAEVIPFLEQRLRRAGVPAHVSEGKPVSRSGPARLLAALADFVEGRRFEPCAELARHPDLWRWLQRAAPDGGEPWFDAADAWVAALDDFFARRLPARFERWRARPDAAPAERAVARLCSALDDPRLLGGLGGDGLLSAWAPRILALLAEVYGTLDLERAADRRVLDACDELRKAAAALHALPSGADESCDFATAVRLLLDEVQEQRIAPDPDDLAVEVVGWLETHADDAPVAFITGFNEPFLPESGGADPFLPDALRSRLGLIDNERRHARDAYQLTAMLHARPHLRVVSGRRTAQGDPLRPSRLLFSVPGAEAAARVQRFYGATEDARPAAPAADGGSRSAFVLPPEPLLSAPEPISRLGVSRFGALLSDPYLFALEAILRLEAVDDRAREMDGMAFGNLAHEVLERFGRSEEASSTDAGEIAALLDHLLDARFLERYGKDPLPAVRLQREQLRARLRAFARWQAERAAAGWRIVAVECRTPEGGVPFEVDGEPFFLTGRIDRVDHHPELGWALLDYKTGDRGEVPDDTHRKGRTGQKEWVDLQLPLYRHILRSVIDRDGAVPVPDLERLPLRLGYVLLPRDLERVGGAMAPWSDADLLAADETARNLVRFLRQNRFAFDPDRVRWADGALAALLGTGYLQSAGEEEGWE